MNIKATAVRTMDASPLQRAQSWTELFPGYTRNALRDERETHHSRNDVQHL